MRRRTPFAALVTVASAAVLLGASAASADAPVATYEVTVTNLTEGQAFTPPVVATHRATVDRFDVGAAASFEVQEIAENGRLGPMLSLVQGSKHVNDSAFIADGSAMPAPVVPASRAEALGLPSSQTFTLESATGAKFLSWVSMLICTNDGFTGVDSLRLPDEVGESVTVGTQGYDAGTEINTEDLADIVPPCAPLSGVMSTDMGTDLTNPALAEGGVIHHHPGIAGDDDLTAAIHDWTNPVASVRVERIS
ncbi:MAG: spondin domain-containing protein [Actinobacteria bacterium]|nr:spondin domain-containing protein [Actinomycetota bacterium]